MRAGTVMRIVALFVLYLLSVLSSSASTPEVHIVSQPHHVGDFFIVNITVDSGDEEIYAVEYELEFDNHILNAISQNKGDFLKGNTIVSINRTDNEKGIVEYAETITGEGGVAGKGTLSTITFKAISAGESALRLNVTFISTSYEYLTAETVAHCTVVPTTEPSSTTHSPATSTASTTSPAPQQASSDDAAPSPSATCSPSQHASPAALIKPQTPQLSPTRTASPDNRSQSSDDLHVPTHPNTTNASAPSPQSSPSQSPSQLPSRPSPSQPSRQSPVGGAATATAVAVLASSLMKMRRSDGKAGIYAFVLICMILPVYLLPLSEAPVPVIEAPVPVILVEQSQENVSAGQMFTVNITVDSGDEEIYAVEYELEFDNHILNAISQNKGDFL
ncbi:MAG: cohesin domain-containing protein, partial [Canidatus Methanoxibalbensis ujae]|nr:cohesin domain-containing protein [Candidatus Methanoxibalbensis ujae]